MAERLWNITVNNITSKCGEKKHSYDNRGLRNKFLNGKGFQYDPLSLSLWFHSCIVFLLHHNSSRLYPQFVCLSPSSEQTCPVSGAKSERTFGQKNRHGTELQLQPDGHETGLAIHLRRVSARTVLVISSIRAPGRQRGLHGATGNTEASLWPLATAYKADRDTRGNKKEKKITPESLLSRMEASTLAGLFSAAVRHYRGNANTPSSSSSPEEGNKNKYTPRKVTELGLYVVTAGLLLCFRVSGHSGASL